MLVFYYKTKVSLRFWKLRQRSSLNLCSLIFLNLRYNIVLWSFLAKSLFKTLIILRQSGTPVSKVMLFRKLLCLSVSITSMGDAEGARRWRARKARAEAACRGRVRKGHVEGVCRRHVLKARTEGAYRRRVRKAHAEGACGNSDARKFVITGNGRYVWIYLQIALAYLLH